MLDRTIALGTIAGAMLMGCGTVKGDIETICNMQTVCPPPDTTSNAEKARAQAECLEGRIKTSDGKKVVAALSMVSPADRPRVLRETAKEHGLASCPEADNMERKLRPE
jgi:hypothetical protein